MEIVHLEHGFERVVVVVEGVELLLQQAVAVAVVDQPVAELMEPILVEMEARLVMVDLALHKQVQEQRVVRVLLEG